MEPRDDRIEIRLTDTGYIKSANRYMPQESMPYGFVVCRVLNKLYGNPELPEFFSSKTRRQIEALNRVTASIRSSKLRIDLDYAFGRTLRKIVDDRKNYRVEYDKTEALFGGSVEIKYIWNGTSGHIEQVLYVDSVNDLIMYDIGKVLERDIKINRCDCGRYFIPGRTSEKYCSEHRKEFARKTSRENLKNNRCAYLHKEIYDRLNKYCKVHSTDKAAANRLNDYLSKQTELKREYRAGEITENQYFAALQELDKMYRLKGQAKRD